MVLRPSATERLPNSGSMLYEVEVSVSGPSGERVRIGRPAAERDD